MKSHSLSALSEDSWKEIDFFFWRNRYLCESRWISPTEPWVSKMCSLWEWRTT